MSSSIRTAIRALVAPFHRISCRPDIWLQGISELGRRGGGKKESGAFLLGDVYLGRRSVLKFVYYDAIDPHCLDSGIVRFKGAAYGAVWDACARERLMVVGDVHTHPGLPNQSQLDREHPMIAQSGHVALIVPHFAQRGAAIDSLGVYEYNGAHNWTDRSRTPARYFYVGRWA